MLLFTIVNDFLYLVFRLIHIPYSLHSLVYHVHDVGDERVTDHSVLDIAFHQVYVWVHHQGLQGKRVTSHGLVGMHFGTSFTITCDLGVPVALQCTGSWFPWISYSEQSRSARRQPIMRQVLCIHKFAAGWLRSLKRNELLFLLHLLS